MALVGALVAVSCGAPPSIQSSGAGRSATGSKAKLPPCPLKALDQAKGRVTVNLWYGGIIAPPTTVLAKLIKKFNESQDKVTVTSDDQGTSYTEVQRKYEGAAATPSQLPDMIYNEDTMLGEMVDKGQVLPAQSCMDADGFDTKKISDAVRSRYLVDGSLSPGYFNVSTPILYYNKVHFKKAGLDPDKPPTTLAEIAIDAKKIKDAGVAPTPLSFLANDWFLSTWVAGIGQDVVNNDNGRTKPASRATFNTPEVQKTLAKLDQMNTDGLVKPFPVVDGKIDQYLALITEQSSMLIETSTASGTIAAALGGEITAKEAGVDVGKITLDDKKLVPGAGQLPGIKAPGKVYASGGAFYMLNTSSAAEQAASWEFMKFMLKPENSMLWTTEGGYLPVLKSVADSAEVKASLGQGLKGELLTPAVKQLAAAKPEGAGPLIGPYNDYHAALRKAMESVLFDGADPKAALSTAEASMNAALKDYNG